MAHRKSKGGRSFESMEAGSDPVGDEENLEPTSGSVKNQLLLTLGLLFIICGAIYVERTVLMDSLPSVEEFRHLEEVVVASGMPPPPSSVSSDLNSAEITAGKDQLAPGDHNMPALSTASSESLEALRKSSGLSTTRDQLVNSEMSKSATALPVVTDGVLSALAETGDLLASLQAQVLQKTAEVRKMKFDRHLVMETDPSAKEATRELQELCRKLVPLKYGPEPYILEMHLKFPESFPDFAERGSEGVVQIEMAPLALMPYSVLTFLDMVVHEWVGGAFHRNAGHVKQVTVKGQNKHPGFPLAYQEYSPSFPHKKYTLGFAGRPSSSAFYVSTVDNTYNHGPGSQGSKTEADACFAKLVGAEAKSGPSVDAIRRLDKQPGANKPNGFVSPASNYVTIEKFELLRSST